MTFYVYSVNFKCCLCFNDADTPCSKVILKGCAQHWAQIQLFLHPEGSKSANVTSLSTSFCGASTYSWFLSLFVLGKFLTDILSFYKQTNRSSGDQNIDLVGKKSNEIAPPGQYFFPIKSFPLLL